MCRYAYENSYINDFSLLTELSFPSSYFSSIIQMIIVLSKSMTQLTNSVF